MKPLRVGSAELRWGERTYVMGIVNVTPDSFSGDGLLAEAGDWVGRAVAQGKRMAKEGADIIDVGGESTRPGAQPLSVSEELSRVLPVVERLAKEVSVPISIDTYKAAVARRALQSGASMVNDVWALGRDPEMPRVCAEARCPVVLMHNRSSPRDAVQEARLGSRYAGVKYDDLLKDIKSELQERVDSARSAGIARENVIIDPGIGFGKTVEQNLELVARLSELKALGYPVLVGPSRKSFVGYTLNLPPEERLEGTAAAVALCIRGGADIVRVHDVAAMRKVAALADAVCRRTIAPV